MLSNVLSLPNHIVVVCCVLFSYQPLYTVTHGASSLGALDKPYDGLSFLVCNSERKLPDLS